MTNCTLLTGATGLIGRYLLRDLTTAGESLCVLVRPSKHESAADRVEAIMRMWDARAGRKLPRPRVVAGEVSAPGLGLNDEDRHWVMKHCRTILHNAAVLEFQGSDRAGEPWRTNWHGTQNVIEFCRTQNLRDMHYVSTAYVSGNREGVILESEFDCGQGFRNDYEESKFLAERAIREAGCFDHLTVYRPAVVAGDSQTGYTSTYHGLYLYIKLVAAVVRHIPPDADGVRRVRARLNSTGEELRNIVPVDWISAAMTRLFHSPAARGGTYHLAPQNPLSARKIVDFMNSYFHATGLEFVGPFAPETETLSDLERDGYAAVSIYQSYVSTDPRFDTTNLLRFTADLPCPDIDEAMLHRYIRFGEEDRWGKRRPERTSAARAG